VDELEDIMKGARHEPHPTGFCPYGMSILSKSIKTEGGFLVVRG
jgi:hypothetical protein